MDQHYSSGPGHQGPSVGPVVPHIVHIRAKPGGLWSALGFVVGLMLFIGIFFFGLVFGMIAMAAASSADTLVIEQNYRDGAGRGAGKVVILPIDGIINDRQAEFVRGAVDHILGSRNVSAVVLRVDSPGGGVTASDQIWYQVERLKRHNVPVVASYGGIAASGGYYVSCAADHIIAEETCITGSIGVIAQVFTMHGLMDKVGVEPVTLVATGSPEKAVANDIFRQWNEQDQQKILVMLDKAYEIFSRRVSDGRNSVITDPAELDRLANGSIYTAEQALEGKLIDGIGYLDDAIVKAEQLAGLTPGRAQVVRVAAPPSLSNLLMGQAAGPMGELQRGSIFDADAVRGLVNDLASPRVMYLMR